ncbi:uncharacterized protein METZ01_LOCUS285327, partial [marine metagenome]
MRFRNPLLISILFIFQIAVAQFTLQESESDKTLIQFT